MQHQYHIDPWKIIEEGFDPQKHEISESLFSIGNGHMGQRANFEEYYSGKSLQGSYMGGVYYPDKTRVGWWKNGYPENFAKVLNATNWIGLDIYIDDLRLDLAKCKIVDFERVLDMKQGTLTRSCIVENKNGQRLALNSLRFCSQKDKELGAISYSITPINFDGRMKIISYLDGDVKNSDSNYDEKFWKEINQEANDKNVFVEIQTLKTQFHLYSAISTLYNFEIQEKSYFTNPKQAGTSISALLKEGTTYNIIKYAANLTSRDHEVANFYSSAQALLANAREKGFENLKNEHAQAWSDIWNNCNVVIEGDDSAQQGIRFNIFHLQQTYTGHDSRLNIGPKGFTGEKYGGSTYWDTEAYCLPFYMSTAGQDVARNLLVYRHNHLQKAIENAIKLGFTDGAALYPMVTMNGEESHNEWEITFEEIHRNGAIAYAIYDYINYTDDTNYLAEYGLDVLISIARFWAQRVHWSERANAFMIHGVTGPNEYENNVNNNWYTNYIARWCLKYTIESINFVKTENNQRFDEISKQLHFTKEEILNWKEIIENIYLPSDEKLGVFVQHDTFLDKEIQPVDTLSPEDRPLNQKWSWDRILRSCFIKQADVLQGLYFFYHDFDKDTHRRNFDFYEPMTVHESSLSPCVHSILACKLQKDEKAYEMYARSARLDLDNYNNDTEDGLHITSMAGSWLSVIKGFGGMEVVDGVMVFNPRLPKHWNALNFILLFKGSRLHVKIDQENIEIQNLGQNICTLQVENSKAEINAGQKFEYKYN